jgi:hypothetical protein
MARSSSSRRWRLFLHASFRLATTAIPGNIGGLYTKARPVKPSSTTKGEREGADIASTGR